jgi:hypothetical protein
MVLRNFDQPSIHNRSSRTVANTDTRRGKVKVAEYEARFPRLLHCSVKDFEAWLVKKFGPEYLQDIPYHQVEGKLVPNVVERGRL